MAEKDKTNTDAGDNRPDTEPNAAEKPRADETPGDDTGSQSALPGREKPPAKNADPDAAGGKARPKKPLQGSGKPTTQKPRKRKRRVLFFLVLLLLLVLAGGGFYLWQQQGDRIRLWLEPVIALLEGGEGAELESGESPGAPVEETAEPGSPTGDREIREMPEPPGRVEAEDSALSGRVEAIDERTARQAEAVAALRERLDDLELTLDSQGERLETLSTTTREDWLLAEAEFLLRLANQRILADRESGNALSLLESADQILQQLDDPDLFPVRKALADDITALRVADSVDREGIYLKLDALIHLIPELEFPVHREEADVGEDPEQPPATWYQTLAANAWQAVKKLSGIVRVEKVEEAVDPRLLPSEQNLVKTNLRLALEQAQLALMREEQSIYDASLARARQLITEGFEADRASGVMTEELRSLADRAVVPELPTPTESIRALRDYTSLWHNRYRSDDSPLSPRPEREGEPAAAPEPPPQAEEETPPEEEGELP